VLVANQRKSLNLPLNRFVNPEGIEGTGSRDVAMESRAFEAGIRRVIEHETARDIQEASQWGLMAAHVIYSEAEEKGYA
jgi:hypothetical protein